MVAEPIAEVLTEPERRRRWSVEQKLAVVAEAGRPGASPTQVARRHGLSTGLLYTWRRQAREGTLSASSSADFVPVHVVREPPMAAAVVPRRDARRGGDCQIVIELPGDRRVRVDRNVDTEALRRVLAALG